MTTQLPVPVVNLGSLYVNNLQLSVLGNKTLTLFAGQARDSTNIQDIQLTANVVINAAVNGENGLDTGSLAASTLYYVFLIGDPTGKQQPAGLISLSSGAPTLPFGYGVFRRVGVAVTNGSVDFTNILQTGNANERKCQYTSSIPTPLTAGHATTATAVSLANLVPTANFSVPVMIDFTYTPATAGNTLSLSSTTNVVDVPTVTGQVVSVENTGLVEVLSTIVSNNPTIYYAGTSGSDTTALNVQGFIDYL